MKYDFGDVPTWINALAATTALIFVAFTLRSQSKQLQLSEQEWKAEQKRQNEYKLKEYVNKFSFYIEDGLTNPQIHFINASVHPIYQVTIHAIDINSGKETMISGSDGAFLGIKYIPNGRYIHTLQAGKYDFSQPAELHFVDAAGTTWSKSSNGTIGIYSRKHRHPDRWLPIPQKDES